MWLITTEWNECDILPHGKCTYKVCAYGNRTKRKCQELVSCMTSFSPYDYVDYEMLDTADKYRNKLKMLEEVGGIIDYNEKYEM